MPEMPMKFEICPNCGERIDIEDDTGSYTKAELDETVKAAILRVVESYENYPVWHAKEMVMDMKQELENG